MVLLLLAGACAPPTSRVTAAEGGWVRSEDDRFALFFPPGALDRDIDVSIERIGEDAWEVGAPGRFRRVSDVYRVSPRRALARDAYAVLELAAVPEVLRTAAGDRVLGAHYVWDGEDVRPAPYTRAYYFADGRVGLVATLFELGDHWFAERVPGAERALVALSVAIDAAPDGGAWRWSRGALHADEALAILGSEVRAAAVSDDGAAAVVPVVEGGTSRTWDARWDEELGLHPFELFGGRAGARREVIARAADPRPFELGPSAPRAPLADPLPSWRCEGTSAAEATLFGGLDVVTGASRGTMTAGLLVELGRAACP